MMTVLMNSTSQSFERILFDTDKIMKRYIADSSISMESLVIIFEVWL